MGRWKPVLNCAAVAIAATHAAGAAQDPTLSWPDIESRIQYGFYTEDARALSNLTDSLWSGDSKDKLKSYYAGLLAYRLTQLDQQKAPERAEQCVRSLDIALAADREFAEALALQSVCLEKLADLKTWHSPLAVMGRAKSSSELHRALALAPKNARVLLVEAILDYGRAQSTADRERAFGEIKNAVAAFETEREDVQHVPGWGASEAYVFLARCYLDHGDAVAARDALERALLLTPEFLEARRLMARIVSG